MKKKLLPTVALLVLIATVKSQIAIGNPNVSQVFVPPWSVWGSNNDQTGSTVTKSVVDRMFSHLSFLVKNVTITI